VRRVEEPATEGVGVPDLDAMNGEHGRREIGEVERHDDLGSGMDRGGQHMPVVRVGQAQGLDEPLVSGDLRVARMAIHQVPGPLQLGATQVRTILQ
jgi:hypothetical protein